MNEITCSPIGEVVNEDGEFKIVLDHAYWAGLKGLEGFSHVQVLWWMDGCDNTKDRATLVEQKPYIKGPDELGVFALRSPERPNPIAVSNVAIAYIHEESGAIGLYYIDAFREALFSISNPIRQVSIASNTLRHRRGAAIGPNLTKRAPFLIGNLNSISK